MTGEWMRIHMPHVDDATAIRICDCRRTLREISAARKVVACMSGAEEIWLETSTVGVTKEVRLNSALIAFDYSVAKIRNRALHELNHLGWTMGYGLFADEEDEIE